MLKNHQGFITWAINQKYVLRFPELQREAMDTVYLNIAIHFQPYTRLSVQIQVGQSLGHTRWQTFEELTGIRFQETLSTIETLRRELVIPKWTQKLADKNIRLASQNTLATYLDFKERELSWITRQTTVPRNRAYKSTIDSAYHDRGMKVPHVAFHYFHSSLPAFSDPHVATKHESQKI